MATPNSPIPAALASGVINKNGTPVVITLSDTCDKTKNGHKKISEFLIKSKRIEDNLFFGLYIPI